MPDKNKFEYIVRSIGERTEAVCVHLLKMQMQKGESISVIHEPTHVKAIEKTYTIGLGSSADWLVVVDSDVLFLPGAITSIREELESCHDDVFVVNCAVFDKIYSMKRWAGVHVYRLSMIGDLYESFRSISKKPNLKIESATIKELQKQNKISFFSKNVVGVHDFHQYYTDIYRKAYLNTIRNKGNNKLARRNWQRKSFEDNDYLVMMQAMKDALSSDKHLTNSVDDFTSTALLKTITDLGIIEKKKLSWEEYINECLIKSTMEDICLNEKDSAFNDFFDNQTLLVGIKVFVIRRSPNWLHNYYLNLKNILNFH